ncbi:MAG: hypothetical protein EON60_07645 [Alphaproteobacteria bacterium]|nr:MAG: hypothetical protein EON60_07645 [Alphaproteobacteria bacterium]
MSYYVNQKCGSCKKSLTGGYVSNYSGIGEPFISCGRCGAINVNSDRMTEWKLKSPASKTMFVFQHIFSVVFYFGFGAVLVGAVLLGTDVITSLAAFIAVVSVSLAVGLLQFWVRISRAIKDSDSRMANPQYVSRLRQLGLMR